MPFLLTLAALAVAPPAPAATVTVGCYVLALDAPKFLASKIFTLTDQDHTREFYRDGTLSYVVNKLIVGDEEHGTVEQMQIRIEDPSRNLKVRAVRTMGETHRDDLQLWPADDLPPGFCNPRPDKAGQNDDQQKKEGQP